MLDLASLCICHDLTHVSASKNISNIYLSKFSVLLIHSDIMCKNSEKLRKIREIRIGRSGEMLKCN